MATQERHSEHHKRSEAHEETEDHIVNNSQQDNQESGGGGGILSYLGFGGGEAKNDDKTDTGDNKRTTRSGAQYGQGGQSEQQGTDDYGSTGKYDSSGAYGKSGGGDSLTTEGNNGYGEDNEKYDSGKYNTNQGRDTSNTGTYGSGKLSAGNDNLSARDYGTIGHGSTDNEDRVGYNKGRESEGDRTRTTEGYGGRVDGDRTRVGERDSEYTGKHGISSNKGRDTGYNQGTDTGYGQGTRTGSGDRGQGYGSEGRTDIQGYGQGKESEFGNQQTGYGNQQSGYGQEAARGGQTEADNGVRGAPIEGDNVKGYAVSAPVGSGDTANIDNSGEPSGQVSGAHMEYLPRESDNRDTTGKGTVGRTVGDGDSSFANVKRTIPGGSEHVVTKSSNSHIEHTSTTQM